MTSTCHAVADGHHRSVTHRGGNPAVAYNSTDVHVQPIVYDAIATSDLIPQVGITRPYREFDGLSRWILCMARFVPRR